jgi:hypothetical protein
VVVSDVSIVVSDDDVDHRYGSAHFASGFITLTVWESLDDDVEDAVNEVEARDVKFRVVRCVCVCVCCVCVRAGKRVSKKKTVH